MQVFLETERLWLRRFTEADGDNLFALNSDPEVMRLEAAAWCCLSADSLEETLILAVNLAGEADTIGAVAGGVVGAAWGREALPARWLAVLHQQEYIERTAEQLSRRRA